MTSPVPEGTDEAVEAAGDALVAYYRAMGMPYRSGIPRPYGAAKLAVAAAAPYIAAKALRDIAAEDGGSLLATAWVLRRADDIERAARAAGKDGTDER